MQHFSINQDNKLEIGVYDTHNLTDFTVITLMLLLTHSFTKWLI